MGEKEILVATLDVLNASIKRPVGTSKVRITESTPVAISHLESGENVFNLIRHDEGDNKGNADHVEDFSREATQFSYHPLRFDVDNPNY